MQKIPVNIGSMLLSNPFVAAKLWMDVEVPADDVMWMILDQAGRQIARDVAEGQTFELQIISQNNIKTQIMTRLDDKQDVSIVNDKRMGSQVKEEYNMHIRAANGAVWSLPQAKYAAPSASGRSLTGPVDAVRSFQAGMSNWVTETKDRIKQLNPFSGIDKLREGSD